MVWGLVGFRVQQPASCISRDTSIGKHLISTGESYMIKREAAPSSMQPPAAARAAMSVRVHMIKLSHKYAKHKQNAKTLNTNINRMTRNKNTQQLPKSHEICAANV